MGTAIYFASRYNLQIPKIVKFYVNDFLIMPIVLSISLFVLRWSKNDKNYIIPVWIIFYICVMYAVLYEFFLPKVHPRYTADIIDVVLYFISGFVFYMLQNKTVNEI